MTDNPLTQHIENMMDFTVQDFVEMPRVSQALLIAEWSAENEWKSWDAVSWWNELVPYW